MGSIDDGNRGANGFNRAQKAGTRQRHGLGIRIEKRITYVRRVRLVDLLENL